ncbi:radical SAM/SPASM domain-containing protein [Kiritimatiella glycovorans]|uniref:4Fe4S-binding SPASM domain-containing protein n=1 Tax=Kiritimatiella glycovorans TaxID=1307763 RepID=A0A0G3EG27_9BACT|nr:radical SAM/SPASM domain-containing protein [Kiritimatiella glycovorans]AKJ63785.1 hypothetical protein L21SP4_00511 [Kiritimatiella glycovorans]
MSQENWRRVTSDEFIDFFFEEQGAIYAWSFQYMPVGRGPALDHMVPPDERIEMLRRTQQLVRERKVFYSDFWNSGVASSGCISAGRRGGYFAIDWNGDITPCVFIQYAVDNIYDLYRRGGTITDALQAPLFREIRAWQKEYGYAQEAESVGNWLCPCIVRDHFEVLRDAVRRTGARPLNREAAEALEDPDYVRGMIDYDRELEEKTEPIWTHEYAEQAQEEEARSTSDAAAN